ncbi:MAG: hypothetical protein WEC59_13580 [Salibacteraceae bacterium]
MRGILALLCGVLFASVSFGQVTLSPINHLQKAQLNDHLSKHKINQQTAFAPFLVSIEQLDSVFDADLDHWKRKEHESWVLRKLRNEHLIELRKGDFVLNGDFVFNLEAARQKDDLGRRMFTNSRGVQFNGAIGKRFFFASSFYENQSIFPNYLDSIVSARGDFNNPADPERGSVPGFGRWKPYNTSDSYDYDYTLATGYVGYALNDRSFIQFGHDKQFVGYGHRSLLLSDASSPYPFLRTHFSFFKDRLTYSTTWAVLQSLERVAPVNYSNKEAMFKRLGARFSYLHFQPVHWMGLGLFDGTTWTWRRNNHPASIEYYFPYAFVYTGNGIRNHIFGLNGYFNPLTTMKVYGQFARNSGSGGNAYQLGLRWQGIPESFSFIAEFNRVNEGVYYDGQNQTPVITEPLQPGTSVLDYYQHNDLSLAHPTLVDNDELILKARYRFGDFFAEASYHKFSMLNALVGDWNIDFVQLEAGFIINPRSNMQVVIGNINRTENNGISASLDTYTYFAFRTGLLNRYLDF